MTNKMNCALGAKKQIFRALMAKKKHLLLVATMLLMVTNVFGWSGWIPDKLPNGYDRIVDIFSIDKCWEYNGEEHRYNKEDNYTNVHSGTHRVDFPGYMSWAIHVWHDRKSSSDNMYLEHIWLGLHNKATDKYLEFVFVDAHNNSEYGKIDKLENYNGNVTYIMGYKSYAHEGGYQSVYLYFTTKYTDEVRSFIEKAGENLELHINYEWEDTSGDNERDNHNVPIRAEDRKLIPDLEDPTISNVHWTVSNDNKTALQFDHKHQDVGGKMFYNMVVKTKSGKTEYYSNTTTTTSGTISLYPFENAIKPEVDIMYNSPIYIYTDHRKTYTIDGSMAYPRSDDYKVNGKIAEYPDRTVVRYSPGKSSYAPPFAQAKNFDVINRGDGSFDVTWETEACPTDKGEIDKSSFILEWSTDKTFKANVKSKKIDYRENAQYSYVAEFDEREKGSLSYYFRIYREHAAAGDALTQTITRDKVLTDYATVSGLTGSVDANNHVNLSWTISDGIISKNMKVQLKYATETKEFYAEDKNVKDTDLVISDNYLPAILSALRYRCLKEISLAVLPNQSTC